MQIPQVLLLGNGVNQAYGGISWDGMIQEITNRNDLPAQLNCPMPLQAILVTGDHIDIAMEEHMQSFYGEVTAAEQFIYLQSILTAGFDQILTTNFSYELETAALGKNRISDYQLRKMRTHTSEIRQAEAQFMLHTYNQVTFNGVNNRIWHIHGEARKPNSTIFGHYYYGNLLCNIKDLLQNRSGLYRHTQTIHKKPDILSWVDAYILGDVYILGFGYGLSEFDLWWLLNRKQKEKAQTGRVIYYEPTPTTFSEKTDLLRLLGVEVENCGYHRTSEHGIITPGDYRAFYQDALADIKKRMAVRQ